jgi:hypothetical protein
MRYAIAGDRSQRELVFYDWTVGTRGGYSETVLAVRGPVECLGYTRFGPDFTTERVDEWTLLHTKRLLTVKEIENPLSTL